MAFLFSPVVCANVSGTAPSVSYAAITEWCPATWASTTAYSAFGVGVFLYWISWRYTSPPGALLAERWSGPRKPISASMACLWGSLTALTALVHTPTQLYFARFFLGIAEGSFFPGVILYLSHWFIRKDRAKAAGNYMAAVPVSLLIGSPVAGLIIGHHWFGLDGWRWLFFVEGMPAILLGIIAFFYLSDWPKETAWLSPRQRNWITLELEAEKPVDRRVVTVMETLRSGRVLLLGVVAFFAYLSAYTPIFWLPTPALLKSPSRTGLSDHRICIVLDCFSLFRRFGASLLAAC